MAGELKKTLGTEVVMESNGALLNDGDMPLCADATFVTANVAGMPMATFEFDNAAGGYSAAPTAGARINIYEMKFNSNGSQSPQPDANYKKDYIGHFDVDPTDTQQYLSTDCPIHYFGADFVLEWLDGGSGTVTVTAGWILRVTPWTFFPGT